MLKNVKTFFSNFSSSLFPQPRFYKRLLRLPFSYSLSYFVSLIFFVNIVFLLVCLTIVNPGRLLSIKNEVVHQLNTFPSNLTINIHNGHMMTNYNRPYFLWIGYDDKKMLVGVIDEGAAPEKIDQYNSYFLLTPNYFVLNQKRLSTGFHLVPLAGMNQVIDHTWAATLAKTLNRLFPIFVTSFLLVSIFIVPLFAILITFGFVTLVSLISYVLFQYFKLRHTYKKTLQLTLHAVTLPLIVIDGLAIFHPTARNLSIPFIILCLIFSLCALYESYIDHQTHTLKRNFTPPAIRRK